MSVLQCLHNLVLPRAIACQSLPSACFHRFLRYYELIRLPITYLSVCRISLIKLSYLLSKGAIGSSSVPTRTLLSNSPSSLTGPDIDLWSNRMPGSFSPLLFHIYRHTRLDIHAELLLVNGDLFNQPPDKRLIVLSGGGELFPQEYKHRFFSLNCRCYNNAVDMFM